MKNSTYNTTFILDSVAKNNNLWSTKNIYKTVFFLKLNKITKNHDQLVKFWKLDYLTNESKQN